MRKTILLRALMVMGLAGAIAAACSAGGGDQGLSSPGGGNPGGAAGSGEGGGGNPAGSGQGGGMIFDSGTIEDSSGSGFVTNPKTCAESANSHSYIGCDYWPTVTANNVWSIFDFAVVVANTGTEDAEVTVTGPSGTNTFDVVPPNTLKTVYLPWVPALKGKDCNECGEAVAMTASVKADASAFHLVSTRPVTVYQFSALEYAGKGGPSGKNWSSCPGNKICSQTFSAVGCFSFSNDASLLLPSTAWTQNYRLAGSNGWEVDGFGGVMPSYAVITASQDGTEVEFKTAGKVLAGGGLSAMSKGQSGKVTLNAGDVLEVVGGNLAADDLSGSLVTATKPIQVITGMPCVNKPADKSACDHVEESVFPAETLGKEYVVTLPAAPKGGKAPGQIVRIVGNVDGTTLTFDPAVKIGATATINAGQVIDLGQVVQDFKVSGDNEFIVATFMLGGSVVDPGTTGEEKGDPSQSLATAIEQYRDSYIFLAPQDYDVNYVNIIAEPGTSVTLDGKGVDSSLFSTVGGSGMGVARVKLAATGSHSLTSSKPVGIQVYGYGSYTSYQYPGGLNLRSIAPPPPK